MTETQFLKFADEAAWREAAKEIGILNIITDEEGNEQEQWMYYTLDWAVDVVGTIYDPGTYDDDGNELTPPVPHDGFHVNAKWMHQPHTRAVTATIPKPTTPRRIFLGDK